MTQPISVCQIRLFGLLLLGSAVVAGCGGTDFGPLGSVTGSVTMDGNPVPEGTKVVFMQPEKGYAAYGLVDGSGKYSLSWHREGSVRSSVPVGDYKILIQPVGDDVEMLEGLTAEEMLDGADENYRGKKQVKGESIPRRYRELKTSGLEFSVKEGDNSYDIALAGG